MKAKNTDLFMNNDFLQPRLVGDNILLNPLKAEDFDDLYQAASDPLIWAGHPSKSRYKKEEFLIWFEQSMASKGALIVVHKDSGKVIGSSRYYEYDRDKSEVAIGFTFLTRDYWGGATNRELKTLMIEHAFTQVRTVWFHVAINNIRSQMAMKKIGGIVSHMADKTLNGKTATYLFYKMDRPGAK